MASGLALFSTNSGCNQYTDSSDFWGSRVPQLPSVSIETTPIFATVRLYSIFQLAVFDCCSFTRTFIRLVDAGIEDLTPSVVTLIFRSTRNQRGNCTPILVPVCLYRIPQLDSFKHCPLTCTSIGDQQQPEDFLQRRLKKSS
jgi:hypothetical protein